MFNSGVMLIDINNWRKQDIEKKLLQFIIDNKGTIQQGDQGVLNAILYDKIIVIDPKYNVVTIMFDFTYSELLIYLDLKLKCNTCSTRPVLYSD